MLANKRQERILELLHQSGQVLVSTLAEELGVSDETIRRDIMTLHQAGLARRVHGGAVLPQPTRQEAAYPERADTNKEAKRQIGHLAASLVEDGDVIVIGHGATTDTMAPFLSTTAGLSRLTVITPSIVTLTSLMQLHQAGKFDGTILFLGGCVDYHNYVTGGSFAQHMLQNLSADKAFIGATAVDPDGIHMYQSEENALSALMIQRSQQTYILAESEKLEKRALYKTCDLDAVHHLITDQTAGLSASFLTALREAGLELHVAAQEVSHEN